MARDGAYDGREALAGQIPVISVSSAELAMATLALLSAAEHADEADPTVIEAERPVRLAVRSWDDFDLDD